jgi:transcriptional regulator with XRE-family HTH domain
VKLSCVQDERKAVKEWLRGLRDAQGMSRPDIAEFVGVTPETIKNLENPKRGFANGFTLLRYLKLLGVLSDEAPVGLPGLGRLAVLEDKVAECVSLVREALQLLREADRPIHEEPRAQRST